MTQSSHSMAKDLNDLRDDLITKAQYGDITPQQAEAQAKAAGLPPLAFQPGVAGFDPMLQSRWSVLLAIAWIAWRNIELVTKQQPEFRDQWTRWTPHRWNGPAKGGKRVAQHKGWLLEVFGPCSIEALSMLDSRLRGSNTLPVSACLSPKEAEAELWRALSEDRLKAEGFDESGKLVEINARE